MNWLELLAGAFAVRLLPPFSANLGKRLVKAPKLYIRDSGILHALLSLESMEDLYGHPAYGASWEGFALENVLARLRPGVKASYYRDKTFPIAKGILAMPLRTFLDSGEATDFLSS
jgi:predicted AAA+ superfamily ATPase